jgi:hypothetical protein
MRRFPAKSQWLYDSSEFFLGGLVDTEALDKLVVIKSPSAGKPSRPRQDWTKRQCNSKCQQFEQPVVGPFRLFPGPASFSITF